MQIWREIHDTVDKAVKYDLHIKLLEDFPRHQIPTPASPSGCSHTPSFWRVLLITNSFLFLYSVPFLKDTVCLHAELSG